MATNTPNPQPDRITATELRALIADLATRETETRAQVDHLATELRELRSAVANLADLLGNAAQAAAAAAPAAPGAAAFIVWQPETLVMGISEDGKTVYKLKGGQFSKYGVRVWPEVLPALGVDPANLKPGQPVPFTRPVRVEMTEGGLPRKVLGLAEGAGKTTPGAPAPASSVLPTQKKPTPKGYAPGDPF